MGLNNKLKKGDIKETSSWKYPEEQEQMARFVFSHPMVTWLNDILVSCLNKKDWGCPEVISVPLLKQTVSQHLKELKDTGS